MQRVITGMYYLRYWILILNPAQSNELLLEYTISDTESWYWILHKATNYYWNLLPQILNPDSESCTKQRIITGIYYLRYWILILNPAQCNELLLESTISDTILSHLKNNNIISKHQDGLIERHSSAIQLLECCNGWSPINKQTDVAYLDFAIAFDSFVQAKLIYRLKWYGIRGSVLAWINECLFNRYHSVRLGHSLSAERHVVSGVPHGSVLGSILFIVYINDNCYAVSCPEYNVNVKLFADDVKLYSYIDNVSSVDVLQRCINNILHNERLKLPVNKCNVLILGCMHYNNY